MKRIAVLLASFLAISTMAYSQRSPDRLWTDPRVASFLMYYQAEEQPRPNFSLPIVGPVISPLITVSPFGIQRPTYQDYREFLFNRPLPGIRQYGLRSEIPARMLPSFVLPLAPPQPIDMFKRLFVSPR